MIRSEYGAPLLQSFFCRSCLRDGIAVGLQGDLQQFADRSFIIYDSIPIILAGITHSFDLAGLGLNSLRKFSTAG